MNICTRIFRNMLAIAAIVLLLPGLLQAAELSQGEKDTIFIGELRVQPSVIEAAEKQGRSLELKRVIQSLDSQFINALNGTRVFQLVERKRKGDIELEQGFAAVAVDPNDKNLAQSGKMAGAKFAFLPQIDGFEDRAETVEYQAIGRAALNRKIFLSVVVQVVDTTTGRLLPDSPSVQLNKIESLEGVRTGQAVSSEQITVELAKEMARTLSHELIALLRPAKVLSVTGKQIMINRGSEAGFGKDEMVEIYATQNVKDEDTGETFRNEVPVGQATIARLDKKQSYATVVGEDLGIAKGCVVRVMKSSAKAGPMGQAAAPGDNLDQPTPGSSEKPLKW